MINLKFHLGRGNDSYNSKSQAVQATHRLAVLLDEGPVLVFDACGLGVREGDVFKHAPVKSGVGALGGQQGLQIASNTSVAGNVEIRYRRASKSAQQRTVGWWYDTVQGLGARD